jgi:hypothetical protein
MLVCAVLVLILGIGAGRVLGDKLGVMFRERVGDVFEEDEP